LKFGGNNLGFQQARDSLGGYLAFRAIFRSNERLRKILGYSLPVKARDVKTCLLSLSEVMGATWTHGGKHAIIAT